MSKKKKILFIACMPLYDEKGSSLRAYSALKYLTKEFCIDVVTYIHGKPLPDLLHDIRLIRTNLLYKPHLKTGHVTIGKLFLDILVFIQTTILLVIGRTKYTAIHAEDFEAAFIGSILSKIFRIKLVYNLHNTIEDNLKVTGKKPSGIIKYLSSFTIASADLIILNWGIYLKDERFLKEKSFLFYDSITNFIEPIQPPTDNPYLVYSGNFENYQGVKNFLIAYSESICKYDIVLIGKYTSEIKELIQKLGVSNRVYLTGVQRIEHSNSLISKAEYGILPRITGSSMKAIHYIILKKPIIATDTAHNHELISHKYNGLLYSSHEQLVAILDNLPRPNSLLSGIKETRKYIQNNSDPNTFLKNYKSLL